MYYANFSTGPSDRESLEGGLHMVDRESGRITKSLADRTADEILEFIVSQNFEPGTKLPTEAELTRRLGVGRSTVREAVRRLVTRNILEVKQGSGIFVSQKRGIPEDPLGISLMGDQLQAALELSDIRLMLEPEFAALAAMRATPEQIQELEKRCTRVEEQIAAGINYREADIEFHHYIAGCSGNHVMENIVPVISSSVRISIQKTDDAFRDYTAREHRQILDAIKRHDPLGARFSMAAHLNTSREFFARRIMKKTMEH